MFGQRHAEERLEAARAEHPRRLFFLVAHGFHHRNDLARDERKRHEDGREHDARDREDDPHVVFDQPRAEESLPPEQQDEHHARKSPATPRTADR